MIPRLARIMCGALAAACLVFLQGTGALAGTTGVISGTVTAADTGAPIAGAEVSATSPTGHYTTVTNSRGFFAFTGVSPDTYTVSFKADGFQSQLATGINVYPDQTARADARLPRGLRTIATVPVRAMAGAYQPTQTV